MSGFFDLINNSIQDTLYNSKNFNNDNIFNNHQLNTIFDLKKNINLQSKYSKYFIYIFLILNF